jgi:Flp pilus assembly pilin Flp
MDRLTEFYVRTENAIDAMRDAEDGATAVEYALMVSLIAGGIILAVGFLSGRIQSAFSTVANKI